MKPAFYLAGAMEFGEDGTLGSIWREVLERDLEGLFHCTVLNPVKFEVDQLGDLLNKEMPKHIRARNGKKIKVDWWHQLKLAPRNSELYAHFYKCMSKVIAFDIKLVLNPDTVVIAYWTPGVKEGSGTQGELTVAKYVKNPVYLVVDKKYDTVLPAWIEGCASRVFNSFETLVRCLKKDFKDYLK